MDQKVKSDTISLTDTATSTFDSTNASRGSIFSPLICTIFAATGIFGGVAALFIGLVFVAISAASGDRSLDRAGTILLIGAIPAILFGSIFVDKINGKDGQI